MIYMHMNITRMQYQSVLYYIKGLHAVILRQLHGAASACKVIFGISDICSILTFLSPMLIRVIY